MAKIAVLGAGAWGTAIAKLLAEKGQDVWVWAHEPLVAATIEQEHINHRYLPKIVLPPSLRATANPEEALKGAEYVFLVVPSHATRDVLNKLAPMFEQNAIFVSATKGIENESLALMSTVAVETLGSGILDRYTCLSGPSFAKEVALRHPTNVVIAGKNQETAKLVQHLVSGDVFRAYWSDDLVGVELGGALKNVIAIAAGASDGLGFGHNTRAGLITRGLAEIARAAVAMGANPLTMAGLAGMGDLVLTCTGELSRNRTVGFEIGKGKTLAETLATLGHVAEGVKTAKSAYDLSNRLQVDMPITKEVYLALYENKPPKQALADLMGRALRSELG